MRGQQQRPLQVAMQRTIPKQLRLLLLLFRAQRGKDKSKLNSQAVALNWRKM